MQSTLNMHIEDKIELTLISSFIQSGHLFIDINVKCCNLSTLINGKFKFKKYPDKKVKYVQYVDVLKHFTDSICEKIFKFYTVEHLDITNNIEDIVSAFINGLSFEGKDSFVGNNRFGYEDIIVNENYDVDILLTNSDKEYDIVIPLKQVDDKPSMYAVNKINRTQNLTVFHIRDTGEMDLVMNGMHDYTIDEKLVDYIRSFVSNDIMDKLLRPLPAKADLSEVI